MCAPLEKPHTCTAPLKQSPLAACFHARQNVAAKLFPAQHDDFVHDVAYDYYGKRIATCSSDEKIKVRRCVCTCVSLCAPAWVFAGAAWLPVAQRCTDTNATHNTLQVWEQDTSGGWVCKAEWKVHRISLSSNHSESRNTSLIHAPCNTTHTNHDGVQAHVGPVWKLDWSHPEFGQILASCSFDRNCYIWEEHGACTTQRPCVCVVPCIHLPCHCLVSEGDTTDGGGASGSADAGSASASASASASSSAGGSSSVRWARKAQLGDSRDSVKDIKFSPRHLGLKLATASSDGLVRVYEAVDVMNLSHWPLQVRVACV